MLNFSAHFNKARPGNWHANLLEIAIPHGVTDTRSIRKQVMEIQRFLLGQTLTLDVFVQVSFERTFVIILRL